MLKVLLPLLAGAWSFRSGQRLAVLIFHSVRAAHDPLFPSEPDTTDFDRWMAMLADNFRCLPLREAVAQLASGRPLPPRAVAITFDDGYADNVSAALPILQRYGLTATIFVASGFLDGGCMWNDEAISLLDAFPGPEVDLRPVGLRVLSCRTNADRTAAISVLLDGLKYLQPSDRRIALDKLREITGAGPAPKLMLSSVQVREWCKAGMDIGGHTSGHPILATIDDDAAMREIGEDRERLAEVVGAAPTLFAYPNGKPGRDYCLRHRDMVRAAGYSAAVSTAWGVAGHGADLFQIPRFTPWDREPWRFGLRLAHGYKRTRFDQV